MSQVSSLDIAVLRTAKTVVTSQDTLSIGCCWGYENIFFMSKQSVYNGVIKSCWWWRGVVKVCRGIVIVDALSCSDENSQKGNSSASDLLTAGAALSRLNCTYWSINSNSLLPRVNVTSKPAPSSFTVHARCALRLPLSHTPPLLSHSYFASGGAVWITGVCTDHFQAPCAGPDLMLRCFKSQCQHFTHRRCCEVRKLCALIPVEPGGKVQQFLFLGAQGFVATFV